MVAQRHAEHLLGVVLPDHEPIQVGLDLLRLLVEPEDRVFL